MVEPTILPVVRVERHDDGGPKPKIICSCCNGTGYMPHEEGPRGATWTVYDHCRWCKGRGFFIWNR